MKKILIPAIALVALACNNAQTNHHDISSSNRENGTNTKIKHFRGAISNGMKGDSLSFDLSADGKKVSNLTFNGWWRCDGKLERQTAAGPNGTYDVTNGNVDGHISEPPNGGATAWRFDLKANINGNNATGTFRMNINALGCDTYLLKFEAASE